MNRINLKEKIKEIIIDKKELIALIMYAVITFIITIIFHEKWRDEAQAWFLAKDLNIIELIKQMSYEGHPPLWHLILMPFAKLGFPYITESIISWVIMCIATWLMLKKSPFKFETKILIIASLPYIYLYPTIARSYCLIPLAIALIAIYYPVRSEKKIEYTLSILLLAYTHILMLGLVGILYLFFFLEQIFYTKNNKKKDLIISLLIAIVGLISLIFMLYGSTEKNTELALFNVWNLNKYKFKMLIKTIQNELFGIVSISSGFRSWINIAALVLIIWESRKNLQNLIIATISIMWQVFIYLCIFGSSAQKINTIFVILIFIAWINMEEEKNKRKEYKDNNICSRIVILICMFCLILSDIEGITQIKSEIKRKYSYAEEAAQYIENNLEDDSIFVADTGYLVSAIIPYTENKRFWNSSSKQYFTYMTWNKISNQEMYVDQIIENIKQEFDDKSHLYLIMSNKNADSKNNEKIIKLQQEGILSDTLYSSKESSIICEEVYNIYKINL